MKRFAFAGAALAILVCAAVALAAPAPPSSSGSATTAATGSGSSSTGQSAAKKPQSWTAQIAPVDIAGSATVQQQADGTGLLTLQLAGMINNVNWVVDVDTGTLQRPNENVNLAHKTGDAVQKIAPDKIQVQLTKDEMNLLTKALQSSGAVIFVSDGHRLSAAVLAAQ